MTEHCVCCGDEIPEGRMVCWICEHQAEENKPVRIGPELLRGILNFTAARKGIRLTGQRHR